MKTLKRIKHLFCRNIQFSSYIKAQADKAYSEGSYSRSANYLTAMRSFTSAVGDINIKDVTKDIVLEYQRYLREKKIKQNTLSCYNRTLRAIYNRAVEEGLVKDRKPFAEAFTGRVKTAKRSLQEDFMAKLRRLELNGNLQLEYTRDFFIFAFYALGMPFVDVAYLRKSQIDGNMLVYDRHKTGRNIRVPLTEEAIDIIKKYDDASSPYVFPILNTVVEPDAYNEYCTRLNSYNRYLKKLAKAAGIAASLTSYTSRHSWASIAYKSDVPLHVISQALGHARPDTTMTYIRELDDELMRKHNDKVQKMIK